LDANLAALIHGQECIDSLRVQPFAGETPDDLQCLLWRMRLLIWTIGRQRIECIGHRDHSR
jgi:hypothetical protein